MNTIAYILETKDSVTLNGVSYTKIIDLQHGLFLATKRGALLPAQCVVIYAGPERRKAQRKSGDVWDHDQ